MNTEYNLKDFLDEIGRLNAELFLMRLEIKKLKEKEPDEKEEQMNG